LVHFKNTGISWFDIFLVLVENMSNQKIPVKLKVPNSVFIQYSVFNMYFYLKIFLSSLQYIIIYCSEDKNTGDNLGMMYRSHQNQKYVKPRLSPVILRIDNT